MITTKSFFLISWSQKPTLTFTFLYTYCGVEATVPHMSWRWRRAVNKNGDDDLRVVRPAPLVT